MMLCVETTSISVDFSCRKEKVEEREEDASESFSDNSLRTFFQTFLLHSSLASSTLRFNSSRDTTNTNKSNNGRTKKESTSEKSGEREDGLEGRERRTKGVVFENT